LGLVIAGPSGLLERGSSMRERGVKERRRVGGLAIHRGSDEFGSNVDDEPARNVRFFL
jgi:hypothetical protein